MKDLELIDQWSSQCQVSDLFSVIEVAEIEGTYSLEMPKITIPEPFMLILLRFLFWSHLMRKATLEGIPLISSITKSTWKRWFHLYQVS